MSDEGYCLPGETQPEQGPASRPTGVVAPTLHPLCPPFPPDSLELRALSRPHPAFLAIYQEGSCCEPVPSACSFAHPATPTEQEASRAPASVSSDHHQQEAKDGRRD